MESQDPGAQEELVLSPEEEEAVRQGLASAETEPLLAWPEVMARVRAERAALLARKKGA